MSSPLIKQAVRVAKDTDHVANPLLEEERARATFAVEELRNLLAGGADKARRRREIAQLVADDPVFFKRDRYFLGRTEIYKRCLEKSVHFVHLADELKLSDEDRATLYREVDDDLPVLALHTSMFMPTIQGQATDEQRAKWLPLAKEYRIVGTYAQTELGHGSFLQGLETTATYDAATRTFDLHSPTLSSAKWWPGTLGRTVTHAVVMAQLVIGGRRLGLHAFIVQLRDLKTHAPLAGVHLGDIGPKMAYEGIDNGYVLFDHVRVPREQMLMKYAQVAPDGTYSKPPNARLSYGTMILLRSLIVKMSARYLSRSLTIAVRYSAIRLQFPSSAAKRTGRGEDQVLNYPTQQSRLFPLLAAAYAFQFVGLYMGNLYAKLQSGLAHGDISDLAEVHATSSGLKSLTTELASEGMETARRALGGHGYSRFSGCVDSMLNFVPAMTYEGENIVLFLQTARYLIKQVKKMSTGSGARPARNLAYLASPAWLSEPMAAKDQSDLLLPTVQLHAFRHRAARLVHSVAGELERQLADGADYDAAWNACKIDLVRMARAHCFVTVLSTFVDAVRAQETVGVRNVLKDLCDLFAVHHMEQDLGEFMDDGFVSPAQAAWIRAKQRDLLAVVRPNAVALVDAFDHSDHLLNSALGGYNARPYETLMAWAQEEPLNGQIKPPGFDEYLAPLLHRARL